MPKLKTHKSTSKRFRVTQGGKGKFMRTKLGKSHLRRIIKYNLLENVISSFHNGYRNKKKIYNPKMSITFVIKLVKIIC